MSDSTKKRRKRRGKHRRPDKLGNQFAVGNRGGQDANPRSLMNFSAQTHGAEMLRMGCCLATERGIEVCAPVHDAILVEAEAGKIEATVAESQAAMAEASRIVLDGFELRTDAEIVRHPDRYSDPRGARMWEVVTGILGDLEAEKLHHGGHQAAPLWTPTCTTVDTKLHHRGAPGTFSLI